MKKTILSAVLTAAFGLAGVAAQAADNFYYRVAAPAKCATAGCIMQPSSSTGGETGEGTTPPPALPPPPSTAPQAVLEPGVTTGLDFGALNVGQTGPLRTITLRNPGTAPLAISGIGLAYGASDFGQSNDCADMLATGASCRINLAFTPAILGARSGTLAIVNNAQDLLLPLWGTGLQAQGALVANTSTDFGAVTVGGSDSRVFTFANGGNVPATNVVASVAGGDLSLLGNTCGTAGSPGTVPAGQSCNLTVRYAPATIGSSLSGAVVEVTSSAAASPARLILTGSGNGVEFALSGNPATTQPFNSATVDTLATPNIVLALTNRGNVTGTLAVPAMAGANPGDFAASSTCGSVAANANCTVTVSFKPAAIGARSAKLTLVGTTFTFTGTSVAAGPYGQTFNTNGEFTVPAGITSLDDVYIVGGGGAGGFYVGGGGGAGAYRHVSNYAVTPGQKITVVVGLGGLSNSSNASPGGNGGNSQFGAIVAQGGGGGAAPYATPATGGSGGGGAYAHPSGSKNPGAAGVAGQGNAGGAGRDGSAYAATGGGGGAGGAGQDYVNADTQAGAGGVGVIVTINGTTLALAGGGGGGGYINANGGAGGLGGGGQGGSSKSGQAPGNGAPNTGGGGGGGSNHSYYTAGNGGSGVVIVTWH